MKRAAVNLLRVIAVVLMGLAVPVAAGDLMKSISIPYATFVLKNGLTLIVHEDHKAPIVAVNVWYHVGSKNEKLGKTGFAHLFEHLMFNGSEDFDDEYFRAMEKIGATELNGTTSEDRTAYFEDAPRAGLDFLLWMESDRMGHLLGAITQAKLDEQRGVVENEKRQYENRPYGMSEELILKGCYPPGHPYSWATIGSMEDLNAASLEDVKEWFRKYYGAANVTLVVAGDVDTKTVLNEVKRYFGDIPSGPPIVRQEVWIAKRRGERRQIAQDRVPLARIYKVWNIPQFGAADADYLDLVSNVLASGKTSRLYRRLVYDEQLATDIDAYADLGEIGGRFVIVATARPGESLTKVEKAIDEELARFVAKGPTRDELERLRTQYLASFIRGIERIGGFGGKSDILAMNQVFAGSPDFYRVTLKRVQEASPRELQVAAKRWLSDGAYVLEIHPFPEYQTIKTDVNRSKVPDVHLTAEVEFPELQHVTLSNGLRVVLAERHAIPVVNFTLQVNAGYAADRFALPGTAKLAMNMMVGGTKRRTELEISDDLARLGATLSTDSDLDTSSVFLSALKANLEPSLEIFADVIQNATFPEAGFKRLQVQQLDGIEQEKSEPATMALRVLPGLLYGPHHAYGVPFTGSGTEESVGRITRSGAEEFYQTWFKPNNASLIVVGDTTLGEITPELEGLFRKWKPGRVPQKDIRTVQEPAKGVVYLIDRPGSIQSMIFASDLAPPRANPHEIAIETMNSVLGGTFTSRINMNLREDKHWSYGAQSSIVPARGQRPFIVIAPVQSNETKEALAELDRELRGIVGKRPVTKEELAKVQQDETLALSGRWETIAAVGRSIAEIVRFQLPEDYFQNYPGKVLSLSLSDVQEAARAVVHPDNLIWVVVGDRSRIESGIREIGLGEVRLIDADGNRLRQVP